MIAIKERRRGTDGEIWSTEIDRQQWVWLFVVLPTLVHQEDIGHLPTRSMQRDSDLELTTLAQYALQAPATFFYPYITYLARDWLSGSSSLGPVLIIPARPLNRLEGRHWVSSLAGHPPELAHPPDTQLRYGWINPDDSPVERDDYPIDHMELRRLSSAVQSMLLDDIRYVYDETKRSSDSVKTSVPSRHSFSEGVAEFEGTKHYLEWYIETFRGFFAELLAIGKRGTTSDRERCLLTGWTINRLAVDVALITTVDIPYVRKWQFFGFLDRVAALRNELQGRDHGHGEDKRAVKEMLTLDFFRNCLEPVLTQIPVVSIRQAITAHTRAVYDAIAQLQVQDPKSQDTLSGPALLWAYRNSRHSYAINAEDRRGLLVHSGQIPNGLPDLCIALWHYILLQLPCHF